MRLFISNLCIGIIGIVFGLKTLSNLSVPESVYQVIGVAWVGFTIFIAGVFLFICAMLRIYYRITCHYWPDEI